MQIIVVLDDHAGTQLGGRDRHLSKLSLYDGWLKPAEELALSKRSAPKGGRATSSAATGANALFYTDVRRLGKRWQKAKSSTTKVTKVHEEQSSSASNPYGEFWIRATPSIGLELALRACPRRQHHCARKDEVFI
jgi:hypothetical protein